MTRLHLFTEIVIVKFTLLTQIIENAQWIRNKSVLLTHFSSRYHLEVIAYLNYVFLFSFLLVTLSESVLAYGMLLHMDFLHVYRMII